MKLVCLCIVVVAACVHAQLCQPGQERFGDTCYQLLDKTVTWEEANKTCSDVGGGLAIPDSLDEHQFIWKMFTASVQDGGLWIGCTDVKVEGEWLQPGQEGYECSFVNQVQGNLSGLHLPMEDCLEMQSLNGSLWHYFNCSLHRSAICERPAVASVTCLREYADGYFTANCVTSHFMKDFSTKSAIVWGLVCRDDPRCRTFNLRQGNSGEICQLNEATGMDTEEVTCQYFYV